MIEEIFIGEKKISEDDVFFIAEIGANFQGDLEIAKKMIIKAKESGVDAVKFQSWKKETLMVEDIWKNKDADLKEFGFEKMEDLLDYLSLKKEELKELKKFADDVGIYFSSTPVSFDDVDLLEELNVPFHKIASCDLDNLPLIEYVAKKNKPIIISTGMGSLREIALAVDTVFSTGNRKLILLHCVSLYPPDDSLINLNNIEYLKKIFELPIGFSDHTDNIYIPLASIASGAVIVEKHFTLDKNLPGWDHKISGIPEDFSILVNKGKSIKKAMGKRIRTVSQEEESKKKIFRRSIVASRNIKKGEIITRNDIDFKRPGSGLSPSLINIVINRKAKKDIKRDELILNDNLE